MCKKLHLYRKILLFYAQNSRSVQDFIGKSTPFPHQFPLHIIIYIIQPPNFRCPKPQLPPNETSTSQPRNLNFRHRVPSAVRSDSVRRPIRFRPPSDQIPYAVRSDSVRHPIGFRTPSATLLMLLHQSVTTYTPLSQNSHKTLPLHPHPHFRHFTLEIRPFSLI